MLNTPNATTVGVARALLDPDAWAETINDISILGLYRQGSRLVKHSAIKRRFPNFRYLELAGTGHFLMLEQPREFNRLVRAFLLEQTF